MMMLLAIKLSVFTKKILPKASNYYLLSKYLFQANFNSCVQTVIFNSNSGYVASRKYSVQTTEDQSYFRQPGSTPLENITIGQVLERSAKEWPNREYIVSSHQNVRITYSEVLQRTDKLAAGLKKLGVKKGDKVGILGPDDAEWIISLLAVARLGAINVAINPSLQFDEVLYCLKKVNVTTIITSAEYKTQIYPKMLLKAKSVYPNLKRIIIWSQDHVSGTHRFVDVESSASKIEVQGIAAEQDNISTYDGCNIQFSSGTTGKPKATLLSHRSFVNNSKEVAINMRFDENVKLCLNVPFFHAFGLILGELATMQSGSTIVLAAKSFNPVKSLECMAREKCHVAYGTPTMWVNLLDVQQRLNLSVNLQTGVSGGAPASSVLYDRLRKTFGIECMKTVYGLTETTAATFLSLPGESIELANTTVGHLAGHLEAMVVDETGKAVPFGASGELWIRGYSTMMRYVNDEENTRKTLTEDGWLKTGDQFVLRRDGYAQIVGRLKDMIIRGGENIFPKEIEDFLITHPNVAEAYVGGVPDDVYGEEICAYVRLRDTHKKLIPEELKAYCKGKIAYFKIPRYIVFVNEYPKTASGKVQKYRLKEVPIPKQ